MLKSSELKQKGFGAPRLFEVTENGSPIATLDSTSLSLEVPGAQYTVERHGAVGPEYKLKEGETTLATAKQAPMFNRYTVTCDGTEWDFKAIGITAQKFGLYQGEEQFGTISAGGYFSRLKDITIDLPDELPRPVQLFLLLNLVWKWTDTSS